MGTTTASTSNHCASGYEESDDEIHTPCDSEEEYVSEDKEKYRVGCE